MKNKVDTVEENIKKIVIVILHYEIVEDTIECINSLKNCLDDMCQIVVVDNGSKKGTIDSIQKEFVKLDNIYYIRSEENLGFAKGNNLGYQYAKKELEAQIIVLANNDLQFNQAGWEDKLRDYERKTHFDVLGPKIISLVDGKNQNPTPVQYANINKVNIRIIKYIILYILSLVNLDLYAKKIFAKEIEEYYPMIDEIYQLHGACLIFANRYLTEMKGLYDKTFMYGEEDILREIVTHQKMFLDYYDEILVWHKEGSSTEGIYGKGRDKRMFYYKWNIMSCIEIRKIKKNPGLIECIKEKN